jgi:PPK2 family polyphosphate:nucleotide phosphotransferase
VKNKTKPFRVKEGDTVDLDNWPTKVDPVYRSKSDYQKILQQLVERLSSQQQLLYASNRYAILLIFQAMDAAGKDGVIRHVMSGVNPQGCQVFSFKHPSAEELRHDFLWRTTRDLPERGRIGIFNRSYYEEVLITRVHPDLLGSENVPATDPRIWHTRYRSIRDLERHLHQNGTRVIKFFLHMSRDEQRRRFLDRIDRPERQYWNHYMKAYEKCLSKTSTGVAPWYVIPADDKPNARLFVSQIIVDALEELKMAFPSTDAAHQAELQAIRQRLLE